MTKKKTSPPYFWNHRVVRLDVKAGHPYLAVTEVHYRKKKPVSYAVDWQPIGVDWRSDRTLEKPLKYSDERALADLRKTLERMLKALDQPILDEGDFDK